MKRIVHFICCALLCTSCSNDEVQNTYSRYRAYFEYSKVMTAPPLFKALSGWGEYCLIYGAQQKMVFQSLTDSYSDPMVAADAYKTINCIDGFIVGRANMPDMTSNEQPYLCFDSACPNCFDDSGIAKRLTLQENGFAYCSRCKRKYNLNDSGLLEEGDKGKKLERYKVYYNANTLLINNR